MIKEFLEGKSLEINKKTIEKLGYSTAEFFYLLSTCFNNSHKDLSKALLRKGDIMMLNEGDDHFIEVTPLGLDHTETILTHSEESQFNIKEQDVDYFELAEAIQNEFPKGRKEGTNYNWRGATAVNAARLKTLVKRYNILLTKDKVVEATKNYIKSFNGDYRYMQILKYFIFKNENKNGSIEFESQLMSYIENLGQEDNIKNDWTLELR